MTHLLSCLGWWPSNPASVAVFYAVALVQFLYIRSVSLDWTAISTSLTEPEPSPRQSMHLRISCAALWSCLALVLPLMITVAWIRGFHQWLLPSTKRWPTKRWVNVHGWPSQYWSHLGSLARPPLCQKAANCPVTIPARTVPWFLGIPNPLVDPELKTTPILSLDIGIMWRRTFLKVFSWWQICNQC